MTTKDLFKGLDLGVSKPYLEQHCRIIPNDCMNDFVVGVNETFSSM